MPTELHNVHQRWMRYASSQWTRNGLLSCPEDMLLDIGVGTSTFPY